MGHKNRVLKLLANKLANEATEEELQELGNLLAQNPEMRENVKLLSEWWEYGHKQESEHIERLFEKIKQRTKLP